MAKRQKHVYRTDEVPHLWAHQTQSDARNQQGNLFFAGNTIYSYGRHFPIARHVTNKRGDRAITFTTRGYSSTTAGHIRRVEGSIPADATVFHVSSVDFGDYEREEMKQEIIARFTKHLEDAAGRRAEYRRKRDIESATDTLRELEAFGRFYKVRIPKLPAIPSVDEAKLVRQERESERKRAVERERNRIEWEARKKENAIREADRIAQWRDGQNVGYLYNVPAMLRISGAEVETSKGTKVPVAHAKRALVLVRAVVSRGEEWQANGHTCHLGN